MITLLTKLSSQPWLMEPNWMRVALNIVSRNPPTFGLSGEFKEKIEKKGFKPWGW